MTAVPEGRIVPGVQARAGVPRLGALVRAGMLATIVAFGTSMTLFDRYLDSVTAELEKRTGDTQVRLVNRGLRGFSTMLGAFRVATDVVPAAPDLVLVEFSHNDVTPGAIELIEPALHGIVQQVRAAAPACEFAFVYLAQPGHAADGPTPAMQRYEAVADYFGFPSFDLATATEALVRTGAARWTGGPDALTYDGIHHGPSATNAIGVPFGIAFADMVRASSGPVPGAVPAEPSMFGETEIRPAAAFLADGGWELGEPGDHERRSVEAYSGPVARATEAASALRIRFDGRWLLAWVRGDTELRVQLDGAESTVALHSPVDWVLFALTPTLPLGRYTVEVWRGAGTAAFGDVLVVGSFA
jgi:lysophospholipase L1-like esterase